jgi:hypothetical protein
MGVNGSAFGCSAATAAGRRGDATAAPAATAVASWEGAHLSSLFQFHLAPTHSF